MIQLRLYNQQECYDTSVIPENGKKKEKHLYVGSSWNTSFWHVMCPTLVAEEEAEKPPFRDAESVQLLRDSYGVVFADDGDWYSVICEGTRMNIACLNKAILCALGAIYESKRGRYAWLDDMDENVWRALGALPMTVLIAVREEELGEWHSFLRTSDFEIVNYPLNGGTVRAKAVGVSLYRNEFYTRVPGSRLYVGQDGSYCVESDELRYDFEYHWEKDIDHILNYINFHWGGLKRFEELEREYTVFELGRELKNDENGIMNLNFLYDREHMKPDEGDAEAAREYEAFLKEAMETDDYKEYLYFKDVFRIVNHMLYIPPETYSKYVVMLTVDRKDDGTYRIYDNLTIKYPDFGELIYEAIFRRISDGERFILMVDVNEVIRSVEDIGRAVCGFKLSKDRLEMFDKESGALLFGDALREANASGRCEVLSR